MDILVSLLIAGVILAPLHMMCMDSHRENKAMERYFDSLPSNIITMGFETREEAMEYYNERKALDNGWAVSISFNKVTESK